jgi:hypothetical protein
LLVVLCEQLVTGAEEDCFGRSSRATDRRAGFSLAPTRTTPTGAECDGGPAADSGHQADRAAVRIALTPSDTLDALTGPHR